MRVQQVMLTKRRHAICDRRTIYKFYATVTPVQGHVRHPLLLGVMVIRIHAIERKMESTIKSYDSSEEPSYSLVTMY